MRWHCPGRQRRPRLGYAPARDPASAATPSPGFELDKLTVSQLRTTLESGERTARSIAELYLRRADEIDQSGPGLHAIIERNPDALTIAQALDAERQGAGPRGPLHGIPVLIKDNIDTADRMHDDAPARWRWPSRVAPRDAFVVARLRAAGAVILGKTNLSEWANFRSTHSISGWSGRGGQTPQSLRARPQPLRLQLRARPPPSRPISAAVAVGTETDGSIVCPSTCGARRASSRRSGSSAAPASSRSRTPRTPPARWRAPSPTRRRCSPCWPGPTRATRSTVGTRRRRTTRRSSTRRPQGCAHRRRAGTSSATTRDRRVMEEAHRAP